MAGFIIRGLIKCTGVKHSNLLSVLFVTFCKFLCQNCLELRSLTYFPLHCRRPRMNLCWVTCLRVQCRSPSWSTGPATSRCSGCPIDSTRIFRPGYTRGSPRRSSRPRWPGSTPPCARRCRSTFDGCFAGVCAAVALWAARCGRWFACPSEPDTRSRNCWTGRIRTSTTNWAWGGNWPDGGAIRRSCWNTSCSLNFCPNNSYTNRTRSFNF